MRRKDREVTDIIRQLEILSKCETINIAFNDENYPYVIPMNFGVRHESGKTAIYLHCAKEGYKLELMAKNSRVGFCACSFDFEKNPEPHCHSTFCSVVGGGRLSIVSDKEECLIACNTILRQYGKNDIERYSAETFEKIYFLRLDVEYMTGKQTGIWRA